LAAIGDNALGGLGAIQRSSDGDYTWETPLLPIAPNTHMECFATHPSDPELILACSHYGQLFATSDGGDWWVKLPREFTEIRGARLPQLMHGKHRSRSCSNAKVSWN
jgi:hypothetical protein